MAEVRHWPIYSTAEFRPGEVMVERPVFSYAQGAVVPGSTRAATWRDTNLQGVVLPHQLFIVSMMGEPALEVRPPFKADPEGFSFIAPDFSIRADESNTASLLGKVGLLVDAGRPLPRITVSAPHIQSLVGICGDCRWTVRVVADAFRPLAERFTEAEHEWMRIVVLKAHDA